MSKIIVLLVEPNQEPKKVEIENRKDVFSDIVGGELEYIKLEPDVKLICNKNGKQQDLEFNRVIENDVIVGPFIVVGYKNGVITSLKNIEGQMRYFKLKNDKGLIEFFRKYVGKSSNIFEMNLDLERIGFNRGFVTLDVDTQNDGLSDVEDEKLRLEMKNECVTRLRLLKLYEYSKEFDNGIVNASYVDKNVLYRANEFEQQIINNLELYKKLMIYHIVRLNNNITYYLFVDTKKSEWKAERIALKNGFVDAICLNPIKQTLGIEATNNIITKLVC